MTDVLKIKSAPYVVEVIKEHSVTLHNFLDKSCRIEKDTEFYCAYAKEDGSGLDVIVIFNNDMVYTFPRHAQGTLQEHYKIVKKASLWKITFNKWDFLLI